MRPMTSSWRMRKTERPGCTFEITTITATWGRLGKVREFSARLTGAHKKAALRRLSRLRDCSPQAVYFEAAGPPEVAEAAVAADWADTPAEEAAFMAELAAPMAAEAEASGAGAAGATTGAGVTTTAAGTGASSFLPHAARATAATMAARTRDLFICTIL